jgi:hypothetical protein
MMKIPNWLGWILEKTVLRKKLITLSISYERSYVDGEQIYESFARQFFSELNEQVAELKAEVEKEIGKKL